MAEAQQQELALLDSDIEALEGVFVTLLQLANFSWSKPAEKGPKLTCLFYVRSYKNPPSVSDTLTHNHGLIIFE